MRTLRARPPAGPDPLPRLTPADATACAAAGEATLEALSLGGSAPPELHAPDLRIASSVITASAGAARVPGLDVLRCAVDGADLANLHAPRATVRRALIREARLTGATLSEASLQDVTLTDSRADLASFAGATLERVVLADCNLRDAVFDEAQLHDVVFERCVLDGASFHRARLQRVELLGCDLSGVRAAADLRGASMRWPDMVANAGVLAAAAGIRLVEDDRG